MINRGTCKISVQHALASLKLQIGKPQNSILEPPTEKYLKY